MGVGEGEGGGTGRGVEIFGSLGARICVPQLPQKWAFSGFSAWHLEHFIALPSPQINGKRISTHEKKCKKMLSIYRIYGVKGCV